MSDLLRVLIIEDSDDDLELILLALQQGGFAVTHERVETAAALREALQRGPWNLVLSDYTLPELNAPAALALVREVDPDLPFVVISGTIGEEMASDLLRIGANDYVLKRSLVRLVAIVKRELLATEQRRAHRAAEVAVRELAAIVQSSHDAILGMTLDGRITSWNPAAEQLYGWTAAEAIGQSIHLIVPPGKERESARILAHLRAGESLPAFETERLRKDGTRVPVSLTLSTILASDGELIGVSKLTRDLSERKLTEAQLTRDALILANVRDSVIVTDLEGIITYWNEGATRLFGWTAAELLGRPYAERYPPEVREWMTQELRARAAGAEWEGEFEDYRKDGSRIWIEARVARLYDTAGEPVGILGISRNITERKQAEDALRQREAEYRALAENLPQLVWITDAEGETQYLNPRWVEFTGLTLEGTQEWRWVEAIHPDDLPQTLESWRTALRTGADYETEYRLRRQDGQYRWHLIRGVPVRDAGGAIVRWIGTCMDLDEQKQELLAQAELAAIVECSDDMIISTTPEGLIRTWNPGAERALGYTAEEMIGRSISELARPDIEPSPNAHLARLLQGETLSNITTTRIHKDGSPRQFSLTASPIRNAEGRIVATAGISRDITEQRRAAEALQASEERFRAFMDNCPAAAFVKDESGRLLYVNRAWRRQFDPEPTAWLGKTEFDFWPAETAALFQESDRECLRSGQPLQTEESAVVSGTGEQRTWLVMKFPLGQGGDQRVGGMAWDVTDRKRVEEALQEREERYRQLADAMPQIVWVTRADGYREYYNRQWYEYTGLTNEESWGEGWKSVVHPDDQSLTWQKWQHALATGEPYEIEYRFRRHDGEYRWFLGRGLPHRAADGRILRWSGTSTDIHDFKDAELLLRDSERRLAEAIRIARMGYWSRDLATGVLEWSDEVYEIYGIARPVEGQTLEWFLQLIHPADRERVRRTITLAEVQEGRFENSYRIVGPQGERVIHCVGDVILGPDGVPARIAGTAQDITDRVQAEVAVQLRDRALRAVTQGILITDAGQPDNPISYVSPAFEQLTGYTVSEVVGRNCRFLQGRDTDPATVAQLRAAIEAGEACTVELLNYRKDGTSFWNELSISPIRDEAGRLTHFVGVQSDVTGRRQLQAQLVQAQKMEGIGKLAGGIAHDFNNMLAVINGYSEIVMVSLPDGHSLRQYVEEVRKAGTRAAGLTRQLLAFSRRQLLELKVVDLNQVVLDLDKMLRRLIGEDIELVTLEEPEPLAVWADPGQLEQVLVNLAVNARDAMPTGGTLTIRTQRVEVDAPSLPQDFVGIPGPYVRLSVQDTGSGIDPETLPHIFEPFFTTKEVGQGTGLGLSTVYGIVHQSGGFLHVESHLGEGTSFSVYLPRVEAPLATEETLAARTEDSGTETILVVEDEPQVRAMMLATLQRSGYTVLEAWQGDEALRLEEEYEGTIHLLVTDVVMPRMSGSALAVAMSSRRPETRILFISGYTDDAVLRHGVLTQQAELLMKPFGMRELTERVRRILDRN